MIDFLAELWHFMRERKKLWLLPILIVLVALSGLIFATSGSVLGPFIYSLF